MHIVCMVLNIAEYVDVELYVICIMHNVHAKQKEIKLSKSLEKNEKLQKKRQKITESINSRAAAIQDRREKALFFKALHLRLRAS